MINPQRKHTNRYTLTIQRTICVFMLKGGSNNSEIGICALSEVYF